MAFAKLASLDVENPPEEYESIGHSLENSVLRDSNDLITPMAAWLSMSNGGIISGAAHAAHKESNRITRTVEMLSKFGIESSATSDGIIVKGGQVPHPHPPRKTRTNKSTPELHEMPRPRFITRGSTVL